MTHKHKHTHIRAHSPPTHADTQTHSHTQSQTLMSVVALRYISLSLHFASVASTATVVNRVAPKLEVKQSIQPDRSLLQAALKVRRIRRYQSMTGFTASPSVELWRSWVSQFFSLTLSYFKNISKLKTCESDSLMTGPVVANEVTCIVNYTYLS